MENKELPKAYDPAEHEDGIYKKWEQSGFFNPDNLELPENAPGYCIMMPPPNVTGTLHMGHASMLALQDILIRYHRMKGERALWIPGTDHAAIATQTKVEKLLKGEGSSRHELGRDRFLERVRQFAQDSHDTIVNQIRKIGSSCDWSREAYTLDETRTKAVRSIFKLMYDDGLIYRKERVINWCPRCASTLADDEVEYKTQKAVIYYFKYDRNFPLTIATTRPETKLGDTAVAVNPKDERYKEHIGKTIEADFCGIPLKLKIIADRKVDMEFGTGALGVTPAHSMVDSQMAVEHGLQTVKVIGEDGNIREGFGEFSGLSVSDARERIVEKLRKAGLIEKEEEADNNLSVCYRCDTAVEPLPSLQWFIDVNKKVKSRKSRYCQFLGERDPANPQSVAGSKVKSQKGIELDDKTLKEIAGEVVKKGQIKIIPERFEKNYFHWMDDLRDWCISRQIWFGHRIPVWYCLSRKSGCEKPIVEIEEVKKCPYCGGEVMQDPDTLDTWFSSGLWTFSTLAGSPDQIRIEDGRFVVDSDDFKKFHPTAVMETGYDILFFWVARMIIMTAYGVKDIPFKDVYLHGLVLDEHGKKMSKSKGNVIDPLDMIAVYGADSTRLSLVIGSTPGNDLRISVQKIAGYRNLVNKLWNIARFILSIRQYGDEGRRITALTDNEILRFAQNDRHTAADRWILNKLNNLIENVSGDLENYRFSQAGERLREFTWDDLADWYLEVCKFEKNEEKNGILFFILENLLKLWHPFIPFVTEAVWAVMHPERPLMTQKWPTAILLPKAEECSGFEDVIEVVTAIRNARSEHKIEPTRKIKATVIAGQMAGFLKSQEILIKGLKTDISDIEFCETANLEEDSIYVSRRDIEIYLSGAVDREAEKARLEKELAGLEKGALGVRSKLDDQEFISKAPEHIVKVARDNLSRLESEIERIKTKIAKIQELG